MRKKRFLAIAAAIIFSISFAAPVTVSATEVDETTDLVDDEQEEGEQTTIAAPGAEDEDTAGSGGNSGSSSSGNTGGTAASAGSTKSSDSSLAHLGISPGSLSPAFSAGTHEYTATVDAGVTAISVAAKPNSSKAVIASVSGAKSLTPGANTVKVVVEAENGATSTYTITVNCGSSTTSEQTTSQENTAGDDAAAVDGEAPIGEISTIDDTEEVQKEKSEVTFDSNGYLIYEGSAYIPSSMMPEGEYVSLDKYNKLYEQAQAQKSQSTRLLIIFVVVLLLLLIVILNLALKLRDLRQDVKLGLDGVEDEEPEKKQKAKASKARKETREQAGKMMQTETSMIPDVKLPDEMKPVNQDKAPKPAKPEKSPKPTKPARSVKKAEDLEILDLNDL
ncbi:MAG: cadherin-like beta sandwich domain-containing protein [Eubacterium sp.]|nr:cadherin-like beta sandwich domain-containing protein [Eubacterium sp.]